MLKKLCIILHLINEIKANIELDDIKIAIEQAGCPFSSNEQLLQRHICLMPNYHKNEPPENEIKTTNVNIDWRHVPKVLKIEEKENLVTIQIRQYMEWLDPRIRVNISAMKNMEHASDWMKFAPPIVEKIWHPNLDIHTYDKQDWKSLFHPLWFQSVGMNKCPLMKDCENMTNSLGLYADKQWKIIMFCKFDFATFPFDKQHCKFRQKFESTSEVVKIFTYSPNATSWRLNLNKTKRNWEYIDNGFDIRITPVGELVDFDSKIQESSLCGIEHHSESEYGFDIDLRRLIQPYLFQYYFPAAAIVIVSHASFIIPLSSPPARVGLLVTQFLTLTNIFIFQMSSNPSKATLSALGRYLLGSLTFVFGAMMEFAVVLSLKEKVSRNANVFPKQMFLKRKTNRNSVFRKAASKVLADKSTETLEKSRSLTEKIDNYSLFVSMTFYCLFNIVYFIHYFIK